MKNVALLAVILILSASSGCKQAHTGHPGQEKTETACPAVSTNTSDFERVVVVRLKYGEDILQGLNEAIRKEKIKNAVILTAIGSLTKYHFHDVNNSTFPVTNIFVKKEAPVDLLGMSGYIFDGRIHAHITVSSDKEAVGGHLEDDTRVLTFVIITLGVLDDRANLQRFDDSNWR